MRRLLMVLALAMALSGVLAGTQVVLEDGQILEGTDVRREDDLYVIELASGGSLTIPVDLVRGVRLSAESEPERKPPPGLTYAEPRQLAGPEVKPLRPSEAQAVFGEPSKFQSNVIDPNWKPTSGFSDRDVLADSRSTWRPSIVDSTWTPKSGFPDRDVLADSRSTWSKGMDNSWEPEDGFRKRKMSWQRATSGTSSGARVRMTSARTLSFAAEPTELTDAAHGGWYEGFAKTRSGVPFRFSISGSSTRQTVATRDCARRVLQASGPVTVGALRDPRYSNLPVHVYQAMAETGETETRAAFTVEGGTCRAISGDLRDPLGVRLSRSYTMSRGVEAYDAALGDQGAERPKSAKDMIAYAFAVVSLIDPDVTGRREATLTLLEHPDDLKTLAAERVPGCAISNSKRKKTARKSVEQVKAPRVVSEGKRERVDLFTWSSADGEVVRHTVLLAETGKVSVERKSIGTHLGEHTERK